MVGGRGGDEQQVTGSGEADGAAGRLRIHHARHIQQRAQGNQYAGRLGGVDHHLAEQAGDLFGDGFPSGDPVLRVELGQPGADVLVDGDRQAQAGGPGTRHRIGLAMTVLKALGD